MYNAMDISKWFLARNKADYDLGCTDELISNLKLQKLLYYAQGCVLALTGKPLFGDDICAWEHGPVVPVVYHHYKANGSSGIVFDEPYDENAIDVKAREILEAVYNEFAQYSAWKLRNMTHSETPWQVTAKNEVIPLDTIKSYFEENYVA